MGIRAEWISDDCTTIQNEDDSVTCSCPGTGPIAIVEVSKLHQKWAVPASQLYRRQCLSLAKHVLILIKMRSMLTLKSGPWLDDSERAVVSGSVEVVSVGVAEACGFTQTSLHKSCHK